MAKLEKYIATVGMLKYPFRCTAGLYTGAVATATGIAVAAEADQDLPEYTVKELLLKGTLRRVDAITKTSDGKPSRLRLLCNKEKITTILDALKGDSYTITSGKGGTILSVGFARRVVSRG